MLLKCLIAYYDISTGFLLCRPITDRWMDAQHKWTTVIYSLCLVEKSTNGLSLLWDPGMLLDSRLWADSLPSPRRPQRDATYAPPPFKPLISFKTQVWSKSSLLSSPVERDAKTVYKCLINCYEGKTHLFFNTIRTKAVFRLSKPHMNWIFFDFYLFFRK